MSLFLCLSRNSLGQYLKKKKKKKNVKSGRMPVLAFDLKHNFLIILTGIAAPFPKTFYKIDVLKKLAKFTGKACTGVCF